MVMKIRTNARRGFFAVFATAAGAGLVMAHLAGGPAAQAATDDLIATGAGVGGSPHVRTFGPTGTPGGVEFTAAGSERSGAFVAVGDVTGDGAADIVTGTGFGTNALVQVRSRDGATLLASLAPFPGFQGGVTVATAPIDNVAGHEVIVGASTGGGPHVRVLKFAAGELTELASFFAYDPTFTGGVFVAAVPGAVVTGAGAGGGPHVRVLGVSPTGTVTSQAEWMAFGTFRGGVRVATGDVLGDSGLEVVTAAGPGGGPVVRIFSLAGAESAGRGFFAYDPAFVGGVWVATSGAVRGPGDRLITGAGLNGSPHVRIMSYGAAGAPTEIAGFYAYAQAFGGGVRVAGFPAAATSTTTTTAAGGSTTTTAAGGSTTTSAGGATTTTAAGATTTTAAGGPTTTACLLSDPVPCI